MAVTPQQTVFTYTAAGSTEFAFGCRVLRLEDLAVVVDGVRQTGGYTVRGLGSDSGGTVTFSTAPAVGASVRLFRATLIQRLTDYQTAGDLRATTLNLDFDRVYMLCQDVLGGSVEIRNTLRVPAGETVNALPDAASRAGRLLGFNSSGQPVGIIPASGSAAQIILDLLDDTSPAYGAGQISFNPELAYSGTTVGGAIKRLSSLQTTPQNFGALGDGTGRTPADDGVDITAEPWNTWDGTPFKSNLSYSPYGFGDVFAPPTATPFLNSDTWDYIGCQRAMWADTSSVFVPHGLYVINFDNSRGYWNGLILMKGQEKTVYGEGTYSTLFVPKEPASFFASHHAGEEEFYKMFINYRISGVPSTFHDLGFVGPSGYASTGVNLVGFWNANVNGVTFRDLWITSAYRGITANTNCSDSHISRITTEYLFGASVYTDLNSDFDINFCNFWASAPIPTQQGVVALGRVRITSSYFYEFQGGAIVGSTGLLSGNVIQSSSGAGALATLGSATVVGNTFKGSNQPLLMIGQDSVITGNRFEQGAPQGCIVAGAGSAGTARDIVVSGNYFIQSNATDIPQNWAITAPVTGVGYGGSETASLVISGNNFSGRVSVPLLPLATWQGNVMNGRPQSIEIDVNGPAKATGSTTSASFTVQIPIKGAGGATMRDQQRLTLVSMYSAGTGHVCRGWALYTSNYLGQAVLVSVLGTTVLGGTITFGTTGASPSVVVTNSAGGSVAYEADAIPMI